MMRTTVIYFTMEQTIYIRTTDGANNWTKDQSAD